MPAVVSAGMANRPRRAPRRRTRHGEERLVQRCFSYAVLELAWTRVSGNSLGNKAFCGILPFRKFPGKFGITTGLPW